MVADELAQFPTGVKEVVSLLVKSKMYKKAVLQTTFEGQGDRVHAFSEAHSHAIGDWSP
jgi:hypothetical protein